MKSRELAKLTRINSLKAVCISKSSHIGSALSISDILAVLYSDILKHDPSNPSNPNRDYFILSKGHACISLYATLGICGYFDLKELDTYAQNNSKYMSHVSHKVNGVEFSTGSLGHGLCYGSGIALASKIKKNNNQVFVILGDGELAEGSNWEAILFAVHNKLDNLNFIIDNNNLQSLDTVDNTLKLSSYKDKFKSFGVNYYSCDGHNHDQLKDNLSKMKEINNEKPSVLVAKTIKGKGVSFMENKVLWHYKSPNENELEISLKEINNA